MSLSHILMIEMEKVSYNASFRTLFMRHCEYHICRKTAGSQFSVLKTQGRRTYARWKIRISKEAWNGS